MHCLQVGILDHHPALYVPTELKYLKGTGIDKCVFVVLSVKTKMVILYTLLRYKLYRITAQLYGSAYTLSLDTPPTYHVHRMRLSSCTSLVPRPSQGLVFPCTHERERRGGGGRGEIRLGTTGFRVRIGNSEFWHYRSDCECA